MTRPLDLSTWPQWPALARLWEVFDAAGEDLRVVGGAVRDALLGEPVHDVDLATTAVPERTLALLEAAGIRAVPTGIDHGTVTAVMDGQPYEITTLRRDVATDGRRATVAYTRDWTEDAKRRDFTLNALYADRDGVIFDPVGGLADLEARRVRFIGEPIQRIAEDALRILRFFRFSARFATLPYDEDGLIACKARSQDVIFLSGERTWSEFSRLLKMDDPEDALMEMRRCDVLVPALGVLARVERLAPLLVLERECAILPSALRRLALLLRPDKQSCAAAIYRLRLSRLESKWLAALTWQPFDASALHVEARKYGTELARDMLLVQVARGDVSIPDLHGALEWLAHWQPPTFPLAGTDLLNEGFAPGPRIGEVLKRLERSWERSGYVIDRETLLEAARRYR